MNRRQFAQSLAAFSGLSAISAYALPSDGDRLAKAAKAQVGVTTQYDPGYTRIPYPGGDVPRVQGVCADVIIRAGRDGLGLDLQKLVHEDMAAHFDAYPSRRVWGLNHPDPNIDHRRVLNLEAYFTRSGCRLWKASGRVPGDEFLLPLKTGDIVTWLLGGRLPHIAVVVAPSNPRNSTPPAINATARVVHNIGRGTEESTLSEFHAENATAHYRWPSQ